MKVLHIVDHWSGGGVPRVIINISEQLIREGHEVKILAYRDGTYSSPIGEALTVNSGKQRVAFTTLNASLLTLPATVKKLNKFLRDYQPDIIHDHYGGIWALAYLINKKWAARAIYHVHNEFRVIPDSPDSKRSFRTSLFLRLIIGKYARIVAISKYVKNTITKLTHVEPEKISVVYNSIDAQEFISTRSSNEDVKNQLDLRDYDVIIGTVGRFVYEKGFDLVLEVMGRLRDSDINAAALFVGEGDADYEQQVKNRARELGIKAHCKFTGRRENVADYMKAMDLFLFCSRQEPFGITLLEAMVCEVPIVAIKQENGGGPDEFLAHDVNALISEKQNPDQLAEFIMSISNDAELRKNLLNGAHKTVHKFTNQKMLIQMMKVYEHVVGSY